MKKVPVSPGAASRALLGWFRKNWITAAVALLGFVLLLARARSYLPYFVDDAFISLRYSQRLLAGEGLTWTHGERVEGYSNFLLVVLVAALGAFSKELILPARIVCFASAWLSMLAVAYSYRTNRVSHAIAPLASSLVMALTVPFAAWSIGGLEGPLLAAEVSWAIAVLLPCVSSEGADSWRGWVAGLLLGLAALTRPDGILFAPVVAAALFASVRGRQDLSAPKITLRLLAVPTFLFSAHLVFRRLYYEDWVPNTAYAKVAFTAQRLKQGWGYIESALPYLGALVVACVLAVLVALPSRSARRRVLLIMLPLAAWLGYVVVIGGDMISGRRHWVPAIALLALLSGELLRNLSMKTSRWRWTAWALGPALLAYTALLGPKDPEHHNLQRDDWHWPGRELGNFLEDAFGSKDPLVAVDAAGATPFFGDRLRMLDMLGLNDRYLAHNRPAHVGQGLIGHELGDGAYLLRRKPDIVVFHLPPGQASPMWKGGREMARTSEFKKLYQLVRFKIPKVKQLANLWVRRDDSPIGAIRTEEEIRLPGYLLSQKGNSAIAQLDRKRRLGALVREPTQVDLSWLRLLPGEYTLSLDASKNTQIVIAPPLPNPSNAPVQFRVEGGRGGRLKLMLTPLEGSTHIREVRLVKAPRH